MAMHLIQKGSLGAGGRFNVFIEAAHLPPGVVTGNGQVDLQIVVTDGQREATWSTTVAQVGGRWNTTMAHASKRGAPDEVTLDLVAQTAEQASDARAKQIDHGPMTIGDARRARVKLATSDKNLSVMPIGKGHFRGSGIGYSASDICGTITGTTYYGLREHFATLYGWSGATGEVDFETGSAHTLGVGVTGPDFGMKQSGTATISTSVGATATNIADAMVRNWVNYRDYKNTCTQYVYRKPVSFNALLPSGDFTRTADYNYSASCAPYSAGTTVWKNNATNYTYSAGVDIGPINVSAHSGWTSATRMRFAVTAPSYLCGSTPKGWAASAGSSSKPR
ncbi:hypothetical protein OO014_08720 [Intrasporangium calvum]|uniref:Uncharacterized protein n=1 Tax=Intrasporangium calvum TaxID=53358 RepID=A0ABT5GGW3_9MICO|nr:hypothetical protein [Intrasporangium calvum]MDC5697338.1 hypothetical protein [Intrasporangium calvum]